MPLATGQGSIYGIPITGRLRDIGLVMYARFGCRTMLPNRAQIGPQIRISDMTPSNQVQLFQCHDSWSHGDGCRETESCINCKI